MMQYQEEAAALERKYEALARPLYEERRQTITGILDRGGASAPQVGRRRGIPDFWLGAMRNEPSIADLIAPRDETALQTLRDIKLESLPEGKRGFVIVFSFGPNDWFSNQELRKTYTYARAVDSGDETAAVEDIYGSDYTYHESFGDVILWKEGMNLVEETEEDENGDPIESFFTLFQAPQKPVGDDVDDQEMRTAQWLLELDFGYGEVFKDKVIPYAVHWYTGEASLYEEEDDDDEEEDDEEDDEEDGDDDDDDDEYEDEESENGDDGGSYRGRATY